MRGQKALPCNGQTSLAHDAFWEFGTHKLNLSSGFKKLCPAGGWVVARCGSKRLSCVAASLGAESIGHGSEEREESR